ncbi:MAG TPA: beta-propeller domain-containing protein, partial [Thermoleophilaceae bacterium]|nr:beta-propeller domain-containing protein [Thermoleophilaceae bacterium]
PATSAALGAPAASAALAASGAAPTAASAAPTLEKRLKARKLRLRSFRSCAALVRYGRSRVRRGPGALPPPPSPPILMPLRRGAPDAVATPEVLAAPAPTGGAVEEGASGTNVQEAGVDEPDIVKAAGSRIFAVAGNRIHAVHPDGPRLLGSLELAGYGHELLLRGDRLLAISHDAPAGLDQPVIRPFGGGDAGVTVLTEIDVSDAGAMRVIRTERIRGVHVSSRLTGRTARVVVWTRPRAVFEPTLRTAVRGWLPRRALRRRGTGKPKFRRAAPCRRVMRPASFSGTDVLTVLTIDLEKGLPAVDSDAIMSGGQVVYASERNLYVATQDWTPVPATPGAELPGRSFTTIHRFATGDPDSTAYRASGRVPGFLLNQFSLSEHDGVLRAASTEEPVWWNGDAAVESQSHVTVLDEDDGALRQIGQVSGLGRGERIFAVRFIGPAGYVVTFRQIDPLYVVDLERPTKPVVRGELKIRGYSAYLHSVGPGLLLGVGQDATDAGVQLGTQLSLFDVSDPSNPRRLHHAAVSNASSQAEFDHHAFLWWGPRDLAVVPLNVFGAQAFEGATGFRVQRAAGIAEVGRASHQDAPILRSFVLGGRLFTLSDAGVEANSLDDLSEQAWLAFPAP